MKLCLAKPGPNRDFLISQCFRLLKLFRIPPNSCSGSKDLIAIILQDSSLGYFNGSQSPHGRSATQSPQGPPSYEDIPSNRTQAISLSAAPTLDLRGGGVVRRDRISEYDSEGSVEV